MSQIQIYKDTPIIWRSKTESCANSTRCRDGTEDIKVSFAMLFDDDDEDETVKYNQIDEIDSSFLYCYHFIIVFVFEFDRRSKLQTFSSQ